MTAQAQEELIYNGETVGMCSTPLDDYFTLINWQPEFEEICTGLWRGYVGEWLIENQRLYLTGIDGFTIIGGEKFTINTLFPKSDSPVFAEWFSGVIRIPRGELIKYFHGGFASVYERDEYVEFKDGVLTDQSIKENTLDEAPNRPTSLRHRLKVVLNRLFR